MANLSASVSVRIQNQLNSMFDPMTTQARKDFQFPVGTIEALFMNQNLRFQEIMKNDRCVGWKVWWISDKGIDEDNIYIGTVPNPEADCDVSEGDELNTEAIEYKPNLFIDREFMVDDALCDNDVTLAMLTAESMARNILVIRKLLNRHAITFLQSNAQPNVHTTPSFYDVQGNKTHVESQYWTPEMFGHLRTTAMINRIPNHILLHGENMHTLEYISRFTRQNTDQRSDYALINGTHNYWDLLNLDPTIGEMTTFLFDPGMIGFFNKTKNTRVPKPVDPQRNKSVFTIEDPVLRYRMNVLNADGTLSVRSEPVRYEVEHQKACIGRDDLGFDTYRHKYKLRLIGGLVLAPKGNDGSTGILQFHNGTA